MTYQSANHHKNNEHILSPESARLFMIADNIARARNEYLSNQKSKSAETKNHFIAAVAKKMFGRDWKPELMTETGLKAKESSIGATIFGARQANERIEFFNDNHKSWFFYQEKTNSKGMKFSQTFHYEVHPETILRVVTNQGMKVEKAFGEDLDNFIKATEIYYERVMKEVYGTKADSAKNSK